jgi:4-hydroxybenzoate polyprenyltransferase
MMRNKDVMLMSQDGWSLPYTMLIIAVMVLLAYFFGWHVIIYFVASFVVTALFVYTYDRIKKRKEHLDS